MTAVHRRRRTQRLARQSIFERIIVGVDGRQLSLEACRQAGRLADPEATLEVATVSLGLDDLFEGRERHVEEVLSAAASLLGPHATVRRLQGLTVDALLHEVRREDSTLLAIGAPEHPRLEEIVVGGVGGELLHQAPCSMLLARPIPDLPDLQNYPRSIVVGVDGSDEAEHAYEAAQAVARHRHSEFRSLVALGGKRVNLGEIAHRHPKVETSHDAPVPALVEAATRADLLVVGSRGLHGLRALGSVSERVAHQASCSVLVVR